MSNKKQKASTYISDVQLAEIESMLEAHRQAMQLANPNRATGIRGKALNRLEPPQKLGHYIMLILTNILYKPNYINYDGELLCDMKSNALETTVKGLHYFDKTKGNGFSFLTMNLILGINNAITEYKRNKPEEADIALTAYETDSEDIHQIVVKVYDDEVIVNSKLYDSLPDEPEDVSAKYALRQKIEDNIYYHKKNATSKNMSFEQYCLDLKRRKIDNKIKNSYKKNKLYPKHIFKMNNGNAYYYLKITNGVTHRVKFATLDEAISYKTQYEYRKV